MYFFCWSAPTHLTIAYVFPSVSGLTNTVPTRFFIAHSPCLSCPFFLNVTNPSMHLKLYSSLFVCGISINVCLLVLLPLWNSPLTMSPFYQNWRRSAPYLTVDLFSWPQTLQRHDEIIITCLLSHFETSVNLCIKLTSAVMFWAGLVQFTLERTSLSFIQTVDTWKPHNVTTWFVHVCENEFQM